MKKAYICSPFKGNVLKNIEFAKEQSKLIYKYGFIPICVHIYLEEATGLSEQNGDREELLKLGIEFLDMCNECWVFNINGITEGMKREILYAKKKRIKIRYFEGGITT